MQNFGRGMWRRVGDFERLQKPVLLQQSRIEQWQKFVQYQTMLKQQKLRDEALAQKTQKNQNVLKVEEKDTQDLVNKEEGNILNNSISGQRNLQQNLSEPPVVVPKRTKKKQNK